MKREPNRPSPALRAPSPRSRGEGWGEGDNFISRRGVLRAGLGMTTALLYGGRAWAMGGMTHGSSSDTGVITRTPPKSEPLMQPDVRRAVGGVLSTTLRVRYAYLDIGGYRLHYRTYEGTSTGPTLRARPGDTLRIRLVNELPRWQSRSGATR